MILTLLFSAAIAHAGGSYVGNGGQGVACKGAAHTELLDMYEAVHYFERKPRTLSLATPEDFIASYESMVAPALSPNHDFMKTFATARELLHTMQLTDETLPTTDDLGGFRVFDRNCDVVQIAVRTDILKVSRAYWESASAQERALFVIHEAAHDWLTQYWLADGTVAIRELVTILYTASPDSNKVRSVMRQLILDRHPQGYRLIHNLD